MSKRNIILESCCEPNNDRRYYTFNVKIGVLKERLGDTLEEMLHEDPQCTLTQLFEIFIRDALYEASKQQLRGEK